MFATSCIKGPVSGGSSATNYNGKIVVTNISSGEVTYTDNNASVTVAIPNIVEPKFDITFNGVKFAAAMPIKLNLELKGISFTPTVSEDETTINYIFEKENVIPTSFDSQYLINKVWGCIGKKIEISFTMESRDSKVVFTANATNTPLE
jgi:hypothetical protein